MKKNILVFPCGSEIGLEIYESMKYSSHFHLIGLSSANDHGRYAFSDYIEGAPYITDDEMIPYLKKLVTNRKIDAIYPTMDLVIKVLKEKENQIGCKIICSDKSTVDICASKEKTYQVLKGVVRTPKCYQVNEIETYPVFIKPDMGYGARGTSLVKNKEQLLVLLNSNEKMLILEYLPGEEYTVDCFTNRHGELIYANGRKRNRIKNGISVNTEFQENQEEFLDFATIINSSISFRGAWFFQVKRDKKGTLCLMEIASRFGGSSSLSRAIGVNLPLLSTFDCFDVDVQIQPNKYKVEMDRALSNCYRCDVEYDEVYVDYDDCLVLNKKIINIELLSFLYKCLSEGKKVFLLTKHGDGLDDELIRFRIKDIFDKIINIEKDDKKYRYILSPRSIFVDDSFAERQEVAEIIGAYTFSPDMICVLNGRT